MWSIKKIYELLLKMAASLKDGNEAQRKGNEEVLINLLEVNKQLAAMLVSLQHIDSLLTNPPVPPITGIGVIPGPVTTH